MLIALVEQVSLRDATLSAKTTQVEHISLKGRHIVCENHSSGTNSLAKTPISLGKALKWSNYPTMKD